MTERALPVTILEPAGIDPELLDHSLSLRFDLGQFDPRITFTRNSSATYFGSDGLLKTAAANEPRIDYDPVTGECKGFLVEESRTNLLTYSEQFDNAGWSKTRVNVIADSVVSPSGKLDADKVVPTNVFGSHSIGGAIIPFGASQSICGSVYFKAGGYSRLRLRLGQSSGFLIDVVADANTGTLIGGTPANASITPIGDGWYRISVFGTTSAEATSASCQFWVYDNSGSVGASEFVGDGTSGIYIWGAQLEAGTFPTSYIKTEATTATRAADSAVMTGTNFSSWYRQDEGTMVAEFNELRVGSGATSNAGVFDIRQSAGDPSNTRMLRGMTGGNGGLVLQISDANGIPYNPADAGGVLTSVSQFGKMGLAYKWGNSAVASELGQLSADRTLVGSTAIAGGLLYIGSLNNGAQFQSTRHIKRLAYYPKRLPNAKLQALTQ